MNKTRYYTHAWYALLLCILLSFQANAHDILALRISVSFYQTPLANALQDIADKGNFQWSYNANILEKGRKITFLGQQQTVREVLHEVLGGEYSFKQSGEYLILKRVKKPEQKVSGYLSDKKTGKKLPNATIYDRQTLKSTTTDENGYYELPVSPKSEIVVATLTYKDTIVQVSSLSPRFIKIEMIADSFGNESPKKDAIASIKADLAEIPNGLSKFFSLTQQRFNEMNTGDDSLRRNFQLSFLPNIGTNHRMSGSVTNDVSINILVGYSKSNRAVELGGIGNITRKNIKGVQAAGIFNTVGGHVDGVQMAGIANYARGNLNGVQTAGILNMAQHSSGKSLQSAGIINYCATGRVPIQVGGIANYADSSRVQVAGIYNYANHIHGMQIAGILNSAKSGHHTMQIGGIGNIAPKGISAPQIAGIFNVADTLKGTQIAGIFNRGKYIKGTQIGLINSTNTIDGAQIGLLNFSKHGGYMTLELSANEVQTANIMLKTGTYRLYTILTAGLLPESGNTENEQLWSHGLGVGTYFRGSKRMGITLDLIHRHINQGRYSTAIQEWEQAAVAFNIRLGKHLHLAAGPTVNLLVSSNTALQERMTANGFSSFNPTNRNNLQFWTGGTLGIKYQF